ncbi:hypothetical protein ACOQFB_06500 [Anaeromyxobacter sp. Red801]|uniref:hypothetical protein n=1 Tax=Anaeromyxobacter sp. Red801 TaxID=3411632 RepID=UPI003BA3D73D
MRRIGWMLTVAVLACSGSGTSGPGSGGGGDGGGGGDAATLTEQLRVLATKRQLFAHQSVGANILYGGAWDGSGGLQRILRDHPEGGVVLVSNPAGLASIPAGGWAEVELGTNGDPIGKIDEFDRLVRTTFTGGLDHAAMKLCFADFAESTDVAPIWARYQSVMDALERDFPGRIVHWTVPLTSWVQGGANLRREAFSQLVRARYGPTGRVFDLAAMEQRDAQGNLVVIDGIPAMAPDWSLDGGHVNDVFANRVATAYIGFMAAIATR